MIYMVVNWDGEVYRTLHYTHNLDDALRMHQYWLDKFPTCKLMVDVRVLEIYDSMMKIKEHRKRLNAQNTTT